MVTLEEDLSRLARFTAEHLEAFSTFILLPSNGAAGGGAVEPFGHARDAIRLDKVVGSGGPASPAPQRGYLHLSGLSTTSSSVVTSARIQIGHGLLGWVAHHGRAIHVAPFELDSSTLGVYGIREPLRSLIAVPIPVGPSSSNGSWGVLACDSTKSYSFTKPQARFLDDVAVEIGRLTHWARAARDVSPVQSSWETFKQRVDELVKAIGADAIDVMRLHVDNVPQLERDAGCSQTVQLLEQFLRLVQQALPPHFPVVRLPGGDIIAFIDNMMTSFFDTKLRALADHVGAGPRKLSLQLTVGAARSSRGRGFDLDTVIASTGVAAETTAKVANGGITRRVDRL